MQILIVDDDRWQSELFRRELAAAGHAVTVVSDGFAAIAALDAALPDIVILDLLLPGSNGVALLHEMRSYDDLAAIPVIVVSSAHVDLQSLAAYGVRQLFDKAKIQPGDLLAAVREVAA